jgi:hypothetical protein
MTAHGEHTMKTTLTLLLAIAWATAATAAPLQFERVKISDNTYESASVFDVNKDGVLDIASGGFWYPGPDFKEARKIADIEYVNTYYDSFSDFPMDVNGNGWTDIVTGGYFGMNLRWHENPGEKGGPWTVHVAASTGNIERNVFHDIDGDGVPEVFATTAPVHFFKLDRDAEGRGTGTFSEYKLSVEGGGGHGFGAGDINGDGRPDMVFASGWMEAPTDPYAVDQWVWHPEFELGTASVPVIVHDVNGDGLNDLIVGMAHDYGLYWLEQGSKDGARTWTRHDIDMTWSQVHDIQLWDIDNDGELELLTGKRYRAHNGNDPGADDPLGLFYYEINGGKFERHVIDHGPATETGGAGIYFWVADIDGNGWLDVVAPGKAGLYLHKNLGPLPKE